MTLQAICISSLGRSGRGLCEVCEAEFCLHHFAIVEDEHGRAEYIDLGPACARDLEVACNKWARPTERKRRR